MNEFYFYICTIIIGDICHLRNSNACTEDHQVKKNNFALKYLSCKP